MLKNFQKKKITGPESEKEYREEQTECLMKEWYQQADGGSAFTKEKRANSVIFLISILIAVIIFLLLILTKGSISFPFTHLKSKINNLNFLNNTDSEQDMLSLAIEGPKDVSAGSEVFYIISWTNHNKAVLQDLELTLRYPDNFNFINSSPFLPINSGKNNWALDSLEVNETKRLQVDGQILGSQGQEKILSASLTYKPINFHSKFKQSAEYKFMIIDSNLDISLILPNNFLENQPLEYQVNYQNISLLDVKNVVIKIYEPLCFKGDIEELPKEAFLDLNAILDNQETKRIVFSKLRSSESGSLKIKGEFKSTAGTLAEFKAEIGILDDKGIFSLQNQALNIAGIIKPEVKISLDCINKDEITQNSLNNFYFGDNVEFEVRIQNLSSLNLKNAVLSLMIEDDEGLIKDNKIYFLSLNNISDDTESHLQVEPDIIRDSNNKSKTQIIWKLIEDFSPVDEKDFKFNFDLVEVPLDIGGDFKIEFQSKFSAASEDVSVPLAWQSENVSLLVAKQ